MRLLASAVLVISAAPALAGPPTQAESPSAEDLAAVMRSLLTSALPSPLVAREFNWGHQVEVANGVTWEGDGIVKKPHKQKKLKNDGTWRRIKVEAFDPEKNLALAVKNLSSPRRGG